MTGNDDDWKEMKRNVDRYASEIPVNAASEQCLRIRLLFVFLISSPWSTGAGKLFRKLFNDSSGAVISKWPNSAANSAKQAVKM